MSPSTRWQPAQGKPAWLQNGYLILALILLAATLYRLWYSTQLELVGDEAYYWLWSRRLDLAYLDKGPVIAWFIAAGTALFGQTVFGLRFFAVILSTATGIGIFLLARRLFSDRVGFWTLLLAGLSPMFAVGSILMTIDTPLICFWTFAALAFWWAKESTRWLPWIVTGLLVGLSTLSKYTGAMELISFLLFCLWYAPSRKQLLNGRFLVLLLVLGLCLVPVIYWNWQHQWPTLRFLTHRGALDEKAHIRPLDVLVFLGGQAGVISPVIFFALLVALFRPAWRTLDNDGQTRFVLSLFLPLFLLYFFISFQKASQANWPAAAYIGGFIFLAAKWDVLLERESAGSEAPGEEIAAKKRKKWGWARWLAMAGLVVALIETVGLQETKWLNLPPGKDPLDRARGARDLAAQVSALETEQGIKVVIANAYMTASLLSFYLPGQPDVYMPLSSAPYNQLILWPTYREEHPHEDAIFVTETNRVPNSLKDDFPKIEPAKLFTITQDGRTIRKLYAFVCRKG
jgi:4-amino-4-deoxy-L-arabinose transferase-like glycosyltransferase